VVVVSLRFGVDLGRCNPRLWIDVARAADALGYESVWVPEHLVFPAEVVGSPAPGRAHPPIDPRTPTFDPFVLLAAVAAAAPHIRVGTNVYNIGLRHPFVTARAAATLDVVSAGRLIFGIGASWLEAEWRALELDFATRGARIDEIIAICRRLWTDDVVEHHGKFFRFGPVHFEPKPIQSPLPIHVGGDSPRAWRRAVDHGQGWIGMIQTPATFAAAVAGIHARATAAGRDPATIECTALVRRPDESARAEWAVAGAHRLIVAPWERSVDALDALAAFAARAGLGRTDGTAPTHPQQSPTKATE
jgi:probable F420-dependent oxidoreductase